MEACGGVFANAQAPVYRHDRHQDPGRVRFLCKGNDREPFFAVAFNLQRGLPDFVAHTMSAKNLGAPSRAKRRSSWFAPDPELSGLAGVHQASTKAYKGSGLDRGHLVAAQNMKWNASAWQQTFLYSAIVPQAPSFNRGSWRMAEALTRKLIRERTFSRLWVITGVYGSRLPTPKTKRLPPVPACFYKIWVARLGDDSYRALAVLMANHGSSAPLESHVLALEALEAQAGLDFLPGLEVADRERVDWRLWHMGPARRTVTCP